MSERIWTKGPHVIVSGCSIKRLLTACVDWRYMTLRRVGELAETEKLLDEIPRGLPEDQFIEGPSHYRRIQLCRGKIPPEALPNPDKGSQEIINPDTIYTTH